ncbi:mannitol 2-dehydrogenase [Mycobacterium ulcerans subsp. shinshuense]|uniref:Mannitol 2-dehydrogenase n=1 Tax=Mycobacterium ulcerans subsp. shinshuense TaxID=1124626 RepID=A0A1B4Y8K6_MYCUL|nr:mannitol 2-dehydrogenase [Mycobacterium ulcerans subsp. shinshuense]
MKLTAANASALDIPVPNYYRSQISIGIAHFGVGGFHRAHQAMYLDRLLNAGPARDWGICGIGVLPGDERMRDALRSQDHLYTLILEHPDGTREPRVIGSIVDYRYAPDEPESVIELLADPAIRIISLTITEGGYTAPRSAAFELVTEALNRRRQRGHGSPTIVSCDNIVENGKVAERAFTNYADMSNPALAQWMRENTRFPNSMVDRITPVTTPKLIERLDCEFGVRDAWPVAAEPFAMWVLEDDFSHGRAPTGTSRRRAGRRCGPVRGDGAAAAQRRTPGPVLLRLPGRVSAGARSRPGPADRRVPPPILRRRGGADPDRDWRPDRIQERTAPTLRQRICPRHRRPVVRRILGPHPKMAATGGSGQPPLVRPGSAVGRDRRQLGTLCRGHRRGRPADRCGGSPRRHVGADSAFAAPRRTRISGQSRRVR